MNQSQWPELSLRVTNDEIFSMGESTGQGSNRTPFFVKTDQNTMGIIQFCVIQLKNDVCKFSKIRCMLPTLSHPEQGPYGYIIYKMVACIFLGVSRHECIYHGAACSTRVRRRLGTTVVSNLSLDASLSSQEAASGRRLLQMLSHHPCGY
ncbi:hypothetical protein TNCV_3807771 [Trichonephila clavipes]|nr:hypothetical protein TNCV_3807771 [Trichonephila clavipes]